MRRVRVQRRSPHDNGPPIIWGRWYSSPYLATKRFIFTLTEAKRPWQDALFGAGGIVFAAALVPSVLSGAEVPLTTSIPTAIFLAAFVVAYASLGLRYASVTTAVSATLWLILAAQVLL